MSFERELDRSQRLVIRLWRTEYRVSTANDPVAPLWVGMATRERLTHPAGLITLAMTEPDFAASTAQLAKLLQTDGVALDIKHRDSLAVLLLQ